MRIKRIPARYYLTLILILSTLLRFYNLNWDQGYDFHPDERNIAIAISNLNFDTGNFNPRFWAYGSLPIYIIYFIAYTLTKLGFGDLLEFSSYILIGRFLSALVSVGIVYLTYLLINQLLRNHKERICYALFGTALVAFLPGMIQFAHFTTFETFLTFNYLVMFWWTLRFTFTWKNNYLYLLAVTIGLSIAIKITSIIFIPLVFLAVWLRGYKQLRKIRISFLLDRSLYVAIFILIISGLLASPYNVLDFSGFLHAFNYESGVARGTLAVFYTQQFIKTTPGIYQLLHIFPYTLTIPLTLIALISVVYLVINVIRKMFLSIRNHFLFSSSLLGSFLLTTTTILYLSSNFLMFVKWTRYMIPALPFLLIISVVAISQKIKQVNLYVKVFMGFLILWTMGAGLTFFTIYLHPDTRISASQQATQIIPYGSKVSSESYDLGILPFNETLYAQSITLLNIYNLETQPLNIWTTFNQSQYFISPSPRIYSTRLRLPDVYPDGYRLYQELFNPQQWTLVLDEDRNIAECNIFTINCGLGKLTPDETLSVFDHPQVLIFRKN